MAGQPKTRRGQGAGAVFQVQSGRNTGKWVAALDLGYVTDPRDPEKKKRKRVTRMRATERGAITALDDLKRQHHMGTLQTGKSPRLADYLEQWFAEHGAARWKPNSISAHRHSIAHVTRAIGHIRLDQLQPGHVRTMVNDLAAAGYSRATITAAKTTLSSALADAVNDGTIPRNVARGVRMPNHVATPATAPRFMTEAELHRFLTAADAHPDGAALTVAVTTGLRIGELLGLRWHPESVDLDAGVIHVTQQLQRVSGGGWQLASLKSDSSARTIPLSARAVAALRRQKRRQREDRVLAGGGWQDHGFVFTGPQGQPMQRARARRALARVLDTAGIDPLRFHDLRHSFASFLIHRGFDLLTVRDLCGHKSIQITANVYGHLFPDRKAEAMGAWDALDKATA